MKKVILPTDFSENSWKAMSYAAQLYRDTPCVFYILNTFSVPYSQVEVAATQIIKPLQEESEEGLNKILERFKEFDHHDDTTFITISKFASLVDAVSALENSEPTPYCIIMGTKGANNLGEMFLGTMTTHIINHVKSPVICVPNKALLQDPKNLMLAIDKDGVDNKEEIQSLIEIADKHNSKVQIVNVHLDKDHIIDKNDPEQFVIDNYLDKISHSYHSLEGVYKEDILNQFAEKNDIHLIVMIKRDRGFWKNLFHHSLTKSMSYYSDIPLLILRE